MTEDDDANALLQDALDQMDEGFTLWDEGFCLIAWNKAVLKLLDWPEELTRKGIHISEMLAFNAAQGDYGEGNRDTLLKQRLSILAERQRRTYLKQRPGVGDIEMNHFPLNNGSMAITYRDVTERRKKEQELKDAHLALEKSETFLNRSAELAKLGYAIWDETLGRDITVSEELASIHGFSKEEYRATVTSLKKYLELVHPDDRDEYLNYETMEGYEAAGVDYRIVRPDGEIRHLHQSSEYIFAPSGLPTESMVVIQDITIQKKAQSAHLENETLLSQCIEIAKLGYAIWDDTLDRDITVSEELASIHGLSPEEYRATVTSLKKYLELVHPDDRDDYRNFESTYRHLGDNDKHTGLEYRIIRPDGKIRYLHERSRYIPVSSGQPTQSVIVIQDITEQKMAAEALSRSRKMEAIGQLIGGIAHDYNNMLGVIIGNIQMVEGAAGLDDKSRQRLDKALTAAQRNTNLTAKLLGVSRPQAGATRLTAPNDFIENLKEIIETSLTSSIRVEFGLANKLWPVDVNPGELEDMLLNLALNARDAMPGGGVLAIRTVNKVLDDVYAKHHPGSRAGEYVMISVSDTGTGMSAEVREQIFDPFFSTKEPGEGTGLGLSMIYSFVQRSDGFITAHSEPGQGASFDVFLPRACEGVSREMTAAAIAHNEPSCGTETVLVVDDEELLIDLAVTQLEDLGYHTLSANTGEEALDILKVNPDIDLLFSDITMPGKLDGYDLALAATQFRPSLKVLLTSGFAKERDSAIGDDASLSRLTASRLNKPYTLTELGAAVRRSLDGAG